jgi:hypothetical protein
LAVSRRTSSGLRVAGGEDQLGERRARRVGAVGVRGPERFACTKYDRRALQGTQPAAQRQVRWLYFGDRRVHRGVKAALDERERDLLVRAARRKPSRGLVADRSTKSRQIGASMR